MAVDNLAVDNSFSVSEPGATIMSSDFVPRFSKHALQRLVERFPGSFSVVALADFLAGDLRCLDAEAAILYKKSASYTVGRNCFAYYDGIVFIGIPITRTSQMWIKTVLFKA
jgi:hypothetical protein